MFSIMISYPLIFKARAVTKSGILTDWSSVATENGQRNNTGELECGIPTDFGGSGHGASPEDFFLLALLNCYVATFKVIAERMKLNFETLNASGQLNLDKEPSGQPRMKSATLVFDLLGASDTAKARRLMKQVSGQCMIINSVKTAVTFDLRVDGQPEDSVQ